MLAKGFSVPTKIFNVCRKRFYRIGKFLDETEKYFSVRRIEFSVLAKCFCTPEKSFYVRENIFFMHEKIIFDRINFCCCDKDVPNPFRVMDGNLDGSHAPAWEPIRERSAFIHRRRG